MEIVIEKGNSVDVVLKCHISGYGGLTQRFIVGVTKTGIPFIAPCETVAVIRGNNFDPVKAIELFGE